MDDYSIESIADIENLEKNNLHDLVTHANTYAMIQAGAQLRLEKFSNRH